MGKVFCLTTKITIEAIKANYNDKNSFRKFLLKLVYPEFNKMTEASHFILFFGIERHLVFNLQSFWR